MTTTWPPPDDLSPAAPFPEERRRARRARRWRRLGIGAGATLVALGIPAYWAADTYLIEHVEIANASEYEASVQASLDAAAASDATVDEAKADEAADDDGATTASSTLAAPEITITTGTVGSGTNQAIYYVADVVLDDITQLRSAFADDSFGENIIADPSDIAATVGAALAVNGDYYGFRDTGIEIRNGVVYRDEPARIGAVIYDDGTMDIYDETTTGADALVADGAWQTLSFGPALVDDGDVVDGIDQVEIDTNFGNHSIQGDQPRTAIGMIDANHYILVVVDGRSSESAGVTLPELAELMLSLGATEAYNLDGGGSSTMVSEGDVVNVPGGSGRERGTSDILWVG